MRCGVLGGFQRRFKEKSGVSALFLKKGMLLQKTKIGMPLRQTPSNGDFEKHPVVKMDFP
jgi:hypothetical protein